MASATPSCAPSTTPRGLLLVVSGPSGVGKTTITRQVVERLGAVFSVSVTTRAKTAADVDGRDYRFIDPSAFDRMVRAGELLEYARVFEKCYGTPRRPVEKALAAGRVVVLEIDVQGGLQIRKSMPHALLVFVLPPDEATLLARLRARQREGEDRIQRRFREAKGEIAQARSSGAYDLFLVNEKVDEAVEEVCRAVRKKLASATEGDTLG